MRSDLRVAIRGAGGGHSALLGSPEWRRPHGRHWLVQQRHRAAWSAAVLGRPHPV